MVARGGIEPPTRGFSGCELTFRLTGRVYDAENIQGVPRKQGDARGSPRKLRTSVLVQSLVQTTPVSLRKRDKHAHFTSGHPTKPGADCGRKDRSTRCRKISRRQHKDGSGFGRACGFAFADPDRTKAVLAEG